MAKKMPRFWKSQWASKAWAEEMNSWADAQEETTLLKQFLADYAGQQLKGNVPFLRKKVKEFVAGVHKARVETARRKKFADTFVKSLDAARFDSEPTGLKPIPPELVKFEPVVEEVPGGTDWEVLTAELYKQVQELEQEQRGLQEEVAKLCEQVKESAGIEGQKALQLRVKELEERVPRELGKRLESIELAVTGKFGEDQLDEKLEKAKNDWAAKVREAIEEMPDGKKKDQFLEWWNKVNDFMKNTRPLEPREET